MPTDLPHLAPFSILSIELFERPVQLRLPFRFGIATVRACPQAFARVTIETARGKYATGSAAELMVPKWFDKNPDLSYEQDIDNLRTVTNAAREVYLSDLKPTSAFGHFARNYQTHLDVCARHGYNPLLAGFGQSLIDKAVLDALCRLKEVSFYKAIRSNIVGIDHRLTAFDSLKFDLNWQQFLSELKPAKKIHVRHTVGMIDALTLDEAPGIGDGLPDSLQAAIKAYGHKFFKLKLCGDPLKDIDRLTAIAQVLDQSPNSYELTLDGNEQFTELAPLEALMNQIRSTPALKRLWDSTLFIEQPLARNIAFDQVVNTRAIGKPIIADESDGLLDSFVHARQAGYNGISSKACKGLYKSLLNKARSQVWGNSYFMSAEDLTTQAGLAVQQDLALVNILGITHVERNGHHYVDGFGLASSQEQMRFAKAHPDLYTVNNGRAHLRIDQGQATIHSLGCIGFASRALPEFDSMQMMRGTW